MPLPLFTVGDVLRHKNNLNVSPKEKLKTLMEIEGYDDEMEFLETECMGFGMRAGVPGICMNWDCDYSTDVEPDSRSGWCEECEKNTVTSALFLAGIM